MSSPLAWKLRSWSPLEVLGAALGGHDDVAEPFARFVGCCCGGVLRKGMGRQQQRAKAAGQVENGFGRSVHGHVVSPHDRLWPRRLGPDDDSGMT
jgi:hypothetical protein